MTSHPIQLDKRYTPHAKTAPVDKHHEELVKTTQKWVAQTFYGQLLKQMRNSPFKSQLFDGGRGGQVFNEMFDQRMADHMARGAGSKFVNAIVHKLEAREAYRKQMLAKAKMTQKAKPTTPAVAALRGVA
jgi:Rod binding domain-containing protein